MNIHPFVTALALAAAPVLAQTQTSLTADSLLGHTEAEVRQSLSDMGYEVRKIEAEHGQIEAYFIKDKTMGEVYVDAASGQVSKLSMK